MEKVEKCGQGARVNGLLENIRAIMRNKAREEV